MLPASSTYRIIGFWGILALVALRVIVGWHFYKEGAVKVKEGNFSSAGFLGGAKGPLAENFQRMLPDYDGRIRLDRDQMESAYKNYAGLVRAKYSFNAEQTEKASKAVAEAIERWDSIASPEEKQFPREPAKRKGQYAAQIKEYNDGLERILQMRKDSKWSGVESLRKQRDEIETKWRGLVKPALAAIDESGKTLENELLKKIATPTQVMNIGEIPFEVGSGPVSVRIIDKIIPIFDMSVGILLMFGLLTPLAGVAAGLFLVSVVLSQFPGYPGTQPTYFQAVEAAACFALAFTDSGRYAGLDFFPWSWWNSRKAARFH